MEGGEGDGHGEGGGVGDVEGAEAFVAEDVAGAFADGAVGGAVDLHALFDDVEGVHEGVGGYGCAGAAGGCEQKRVRGEKWGWAREGNVPAATGW